MRKFLLSLLLMLPALASGPFAFAQWVGPISITSTQCASIGADANATVVMYVAGTWTGTLQPQGTIQGQAPFNVQATPSTSSTAQSTITANGAYVASVAGYSTFQLCGATVASGTAIVYLNASMRELAGGNGGAAATVPFSGVTPGTNTGALVMGSGGSLTPVNIGQIFASGDLWTIGASAPSYTMALTGGSFLPGHAEAIRLTLNTAAGQTLPGGEITISNNVNGCTSGITCSVTVTAPGATCGALPCGGYTGYTVFNKDCSSGVCTGGELAVAGCINITTNCTFGTAGAGAAMPTVGTAFFQPSPQGTNLCSPGTNPALFAQDISGSWFPYAGVDSANTGVNPPSPYNKLSFCRPVWFNDTGLDPPSGRNSLVLIFHQQNGVVTNINNQDRGMFIFTQNPTGDAATHYALEGLQVEQDVNGTPTINGSPDGEVTAGSFQLSFSATSNTTSNAYGANAIRATLYRQAAAGIDTNGMSGVNSQVLNNSSVAGGGLQMNAFNAVCNNSIGLASGAQCNGLRFVPPATANRFGNGVNFLWMVGNAGLTPVQGSDWLIRNDLYNYAANLGGPAYAVSLGPSDATPLLVNGDVTLTGSLTTAQQTIASINNPTCAGGASTYTYQFVGVDTNGGTVSSATMNTPGTCVNPLTAPNPATFSATSTGLANTLILGQFARVDVYRTGGPMGTGKIGSLTITGGGGTWTCPHSTISNQFACTNIIDTGLVADGTTPPISNSTGGVKTAGYLRGGLNAKRVTANFTTAANTSLQTITGLSWTLPSFADSYSFHCALSYSQATAVVAVAFGIQAATVAPTNIFAKGRQQITVGPPATYVSATLATLSTTTATNIVSGTPGVIATNYEADLDGTFELPVGENTVNIMVSTANSADLVTVLRGSYCQLF